MKFIATSALALAVALSSTGANAATFIQLPGSTADLSEVLYANFAGTNSLLTLKSGPSSYLVDVSAPAPISVGNGNGVATVSGTGNYFTGFTSLTIDPQSPVAGFSALQLQIDGISDRSGRVKSPADNFDLRVYFDNGLFEDFLNVTLNSQSKYLLTVSGSEVIASVVFSDLRALNGNTTLFQSVKQISFTPVLDAVPEPTTWAMMIGGLALAGMAMRRRKTVVSFS